MSPTQPLLSWYKGRIFADNKLEMRSDDPALLYGASIFTTMRVYQQSLNDPLTSWSAHRQRLSQSINNLGWDEPDWGRVKQGVEILMSRYQLIRVAIFPSGEELVTGRDLPPDLWYRQLNGVKALIVADPDSHRVLPAYKTGNYLPCWLALNRAQKLGAQEAILVDRQGNWLETSTGNLWGWREGRWWTPSLSQPILPGIRRAQLIDWLSKSYLPVSEAVWEPNFVEGLEVVAYSNCAIEVVPIHTTIQDRGSTTYQVDDSALAQLRGFFTSFQA